MSAAILVDIETLGRKPGCAVLSIGAVRFDIGLLRGGAPEALTEPRFDTFYRAIDLEDSGRHGYTIEAETVLWWARQSREAAEAAFGLIDPAAPLGAVLADFTAWCDIHPAPDGIYGNAPSFDLSILGECYDREGIAAPWKYWEERDVRTELAAYDRRGVDVAAVRADLAARARTRIPHHALHDAMWEARLLMACEAAAEGGRP